MRRMITIVFLLSQISSCALLDLGSDGNSLIIEQDRITDDIKYSSHALTKLFNEHTAGFSQGPKDTLLVSNAIAINPYVIKSHQTLIYHLQVSIISDIKNQTKEIFFRCTDKNFMSHLLTQSELEKIMITELLKKLSETKTVSYQREVVDLIILPDLFNYLADCSADLLFRARGNRNIIDSGLGANQLKLKNELKIFKQQILSLH